MSTPLTNNSVVLAALTHQEFAVLEKLCVRVRRHDLSTDCTNLV